MTRKSRFSRLLIGSAAAALATLSVAVLPAPRANAATVSVMNCNDSGTGSLRQAVNSANAGDVINFTVTCPAASPIILTSGTIDIAVNLTITGPGASSLVVSGDNAATVFEVDPGVMATISGITIENGNTGIGCFAGCASSGGGIENNGSLTVTDSTLSDNSANAGCVSNCGASGGGIENNGTLAVMDSTLSDNSANGSCGFECSGSGGGIQNNGTMSVTTSTLSDNSANGGCLGGCAASGGGIENVQGATASLTDSTVDDNGAGLGCTIGCGSSGGGIDNGGTLTVQNSTVAGNGAGSFCGADCAAFGGGIDNENTGNLDLLNSTLSANFVVVGCSVGCGAFGGDLFNAGTASVGATILANSDNLGGDCVLGSPLTDLGYNLDDDGSCGFTPAENDFSDTPSGLDPAGPQNNGGPTQTIELGQMSVAVDHVTAALCPATDQRGNPRFAPCDIGAFDTDAPLSQGSQVHDVIQIETSPSYAGDPVHIDSSQLQHACNGTISFETLQGGTTRVPTTSINAISAILDDDGNVTVVVDGSNCAPGTDVIEADLTVAPFITATATLTVDPPVVTPAGVSAYPPAEVETGNSPESGESDVYTVFYVETSPVYAEQPVEISSPELDSRCGEGWRWEPGVGDPINQGSGTTEARSILDDDGNAEFVFKGASCATGPSAVIADVLAGTHPTYTTTFTVEAPVPTLASTMVAAAKGAKGMKAAKKHHKGHGGKGSGSGGSGSGSGTGSGGTTAPMTVEVDPNPVIETGVPQSAPPADLTISKTDNDGGSSITNSEGTVQAGGDIVYTITVTNVGSTAADGVTIKDPLSSNPGLTGDSYSSGENGGATGATPAGNGDIDDTVDLPPGASVVYTVGATLTCADTGNLSNTATASSPGTTVSATDVDQIDGATNYCVP